MPFLSLQKKIADPEYFKRQSDLHPRQHAYEIDLELGFHIQEIEENYLKQYAAYDKDGSLENKNHYEGPETWIGLPPQTLQTPYSEIHDFLLLLKKTQFEIKTIVDLGAAYGRIGIVMRAIFPQAQFIGFEIMKERAIEAERIWKKLNLTHCKMVSENILNEKFFLPKAEAYFIYDFSRPSDLRLLLDRFSKKLESPTDHFFIIARGKGIRSLIQHEYPEFWALYGAIHDLEWSLYSSFCDLENKFS